MQLLRPLIGLIAATTIAVPCDAEVPSDVFVQSDQFYSPAVDVGNRFAIEETVSTAHQRYIDSMLAEGYPLHSIMLHAITEGMSISDATYLAVLAKPALAPEIYRTAKELLPLMPGWVCNLEADIDVRYPLYYPAESLGPAPAVAEVARRFFDAGELLGYRDPVSGSWTYPDWTRGEHHLRADIGELIAISRDERDATSAAGPDATWYQTRASRPGAGEGDPPVVLVSLYRNGRRIVVDAPESRLGALKQRGEQSVPVVLVYNDSRSIPLSDLASGSAATPEPYGQVTIDSVATRYFSTGERLAPPREWHDGDFHILAPLSDVQRLYRRTDTTEMASEVREQVAREIREEGFWPPVMVTLNAESGLVWADSQARLAIAADTGVEAVPVVFLYQQTRRFPPDARADCEPSVCRAVVAAGGDPETDSCPAVGDRS